MCDYSYLRAIFILQIASTLLMTGIIWFVQIVHYPLFAKVDAASFVRYEAEHATRTGWVVGPLMCVELATAALMLMAQFRPASVTKSSAWIGLALALLIWCSTAFIQVPLHQRLAAGFDAAVIARLVSTNWLRTITWTLRSVLVLSWIARLLY
jgi:hypothetical protein